MGKLSQLLLTLVVSLSIPVAASEKDPSRYLIAFRGENPWPVGLLGLVHSDGTGLKFLDLTRPMQKSWQWGPCLSNENVVVTSLEAADVAQIRAGKVVSNSWLYSFTTGKLTRLLTRSPLSKNINVRTILPNKKRIIAQVILNGEQLLYTMDLDGGNQVLLTKPGQGLCYGVSLNPQGDQIAFHVTGGSGGLFNPGHYSINVIDLTTGKRSLVAGNEGHLYFGPHWSPDGKWLAFLDCHTAIDSQQFSANLCIARPDGSGYRVVTKESRHWFGTGFGSNTTSWSPDGNTLTFSRLLAGSTRSGKGGTQICLLNPFTGSVKELTKPREGHWTCRLTWSPDGRQLAFVRTDLKGRQLWVMDANGKNIRALTRGFQDRGADYPVWLPNRP